MSRDEFAETLRQALRSETRGASLGFTERVLSELPDRPRRQRTLRRPVLVAATLTLVLVAALAAWRGVETSARIDADTRARQELLEEYRRLEADLNEVRQLVDDAEPVLYLGGTETFDLLYDLESYPSEARGDVRPAAMPNRG